MLLARRAAWDDYPGVWEFIGGGADGQPHTVALTREVSEETGLTVTLVGELLHTVGFEVAGGRDFDERTYDVRAEGTVELSVEHDAWVWHHPRRPFTEPLSPTCALVLDRLARQPA